MSHFRHQKYLYMLTPENSPRLYLENVRSDRANIVTAQIGGHMMVSDEMKSGTC